jgi:hypothetical protein
VRFQLLPYDVEITADDESLVAQLAYVANGARQDVAVQHRLALDVKQRGPYVVTEGDRVIDTVITPDDVLYVVYRQCYQRALEGQLADGWLPFHGGLVTIGGRRTLVMGEKGAGKTTLMLRLLHDGHDVEADEMVFGRGAVAMALPRQFHLKPGAERLVPELRARFGSLPSTSTSDGLQITAFDPTVAGFDWHLRVAPLDRAVVLRANHGGTTSVRPLTSVDLVHRVVEHAFPLNDSRSRLLRTAAGLVGQVDGIELVVGSVEEAATALVDFATLSTS